MSDYKVILKHYESCLEKYGDTHKGVDWPNYGDAVKRYEVMLDLVKTNEQSNTLLDFGCGAAHLYEYILNNKIEGIEYSGLDLSQKFIELCKKKYPMIKFYLVDILKEGSQVPDFDYVIMNGVFTEKRELSFDEMFEYFKQMVKTVYKKTKKGVAFNVMSKHVDWERDDLFHLPFDTLANFLTGEVSRNFVFRNDYGLYEYTTYIYK